MIRNKMAGRPQSGGLGLDIFNPDELQQIHLATLEVLWQTGIYVQDDEALEVFKKAGALIDAGKSLVRIPPRLVESALDSAPQKVVLRGRNKANDTVVEGRRVSFTNFGDAVNINDAYTDEHRETTKKDMGDLARVIDSLAVITILEEMAAPHDVPPEVASLHAYEAMVLNSSKHINIGPLERRTCEQVITMAEAVQKATRPELFGDHSQLPISFITCPVSPLRLVDSTCAVIITAAKHSIPCTVLSMAMSGGSAPVHLAGTLVGHNAEVLSGLTLSQLINPGTPVIYGSSTTALDLKTASATVGSPELALISSAVAAMARYYLLPSWVAGG
jgi:trimethylamine--corrinoid protein Co-methyltransferase